METASPALIEQIQQDLPDKKIEVWFQDEVRFGQQGTLSHMWAPQGTAIKQTEYEWVYLFAAVNPTTGDSSAMLAPTVNTDDMNEHLRFISEQAGQDKHVVLVLDQAGWHVAKALKVPDNVTLLRLPPYSPELNPVERVWAYLKSHYLANRVFKNYDDLFDASRRAWNSLAESDLNSICNTDWIVRTN